MQQLILFLALISGTAKIAILHHANQSIADNGSYAMRPGDYGYNGNSFHRILDTHEYYHFPVDLHMSGVLAQSYGWMRNDRGLLDRMRNDDIVYIVGGTYAEHIMPYVDREMNEFSLWYVQDVYKNLIKEVGWPNYPNAIWIPERVFKDQTGMPYSLIKILNDKYGKWGHASNGQWVYMPPVIVLDDHVVGWYHSYYHDGTRCDNPFKIHQMFDNEGNRVFIIFISKTARDNLVWQDVSNNDNPLHQLLWNLHNSPDQEQVVLYADDWEKAAGVAGWDFGHPGAPSSSYDHNIAWMKSQSWIQPVHICEVAKWWGVDKIYDSDPNNDPPTITIHYATYQELHEWTGGNYDNWYNDFKNTQGYDCGNGYDRNNNGIRGDYEDLWKWAKGELMMAPDNRLAKMGWVTLMAMMYETAWHTGPGGQLEGWGKNLWNHTRYAGGFARGAKWLRDLGSINTPQIEVGDYDGDGIEEYAIFNDQVFAIFDRRGGRALWVFNRDGDVIVGNLFTNYGGEGDYDDGGHPGLFEESQAENSWCNITYETHGDTAILHINEAYNAGGGTENDLQKDVILIKGKPYFKVNYHSRWDNWTKAGVSPDAWDMLIHGYNLSFINGMTPNGWQYAGYENNTSHAKGCFVWGSGQGLTYHNKGKMSSFAEKIELGGRGGDYTIYFFAGRGPVEIDEPGPGDKDGPIIYGGWQSPSDVVHARDSVLVTRYITDMSGVKSASIHYGVNGNWSYPDVIMHRDNGREYDFNGNGQPDYDLFGGYIPAYPGGSRVEYVIHAVDSLNNESWDNNYGNNYSYIVNMRNFIMDGNLDEGAKLLTEQDGRKLYYIFDPDGLQIYFALTGNINENNNREYIFISAYPSHIVTSPWGRYEMASYDYYLVADEGGAFWRNQNGTIVNDTSFKCIYARGLLEGVIKLNSLPRNLYILSLGFDQFNIAWALPRLSNPVEDIKDGNKFIHLDLRDITKNALSATINCSDNHSNKSMILKDNTIILPFPANYNPKELAVYNVNGQKVKVQEIIKRNGIMIKLPEKAGIYFLKQGDKTLKKLLLLR